MREGLLAGAAAALAPNLFRAGMVALSDALGLTLALAALIIALESNRPWRWLAAGLIAGAAAMTRCPFAVVALALIVWAVTDPKSRSCAIACAIGFGLVIGPVVIWQWLSAGCFPCHMQAVHYCVRSFREAMWHAGAVIDPLYALHHPADVAALCLRNTCRYASDLLLGPRGLFLLGLGLIVWALTRRGPAVTREQKLILAIAALSFAVHAFTWSVPAVKGSRFMLLSYCLLLPFAAAGLTQQTRRYARSAAAIALALTGIAYIWGCWTASSFAGTDFALPANEVRSIIDSLPSGTNLASDNPWVVNYSTGIPTALLPRDLDSQSLSRYIHDLNIGRIVLLTRRRRLPAARSKIQNPRSQMDQGQNAYDGRPKIIPHIVQKLPTTHSPSITPRKNGSARL
jgi:hypothetical protein